MLKGLMDSEPTNNTNNFKIIECNKKICVNVEEETLTYKNIKIKKRTDGRWFARWRKSGINYYVYAKTNKECYNKLKEKLKENIKTALKTNLKFFDYIDKWLEVYKKPPKTSKGTYQTYLCHIKNHIKKLLPNIDMNNITPIMLNEAIGKVAGRTQEYISQLLRQIFKQAFNDLIIKKDIERNIIKITHKRKEGLAFTAEQRNIILSNCKKINYGYAFELALYTGCRKGELLAIKKDDIDYKKELIHIPGTKTTLSDRYIPMFEKLKTILKSFTPGKDNLLGISSKTLQRQTKELINLCGFHFMFKDFRTTFGTMCAESGISDKVISKWMGHTTIQTTNKYYIKILTDFEKQQAKLFENKTI